MEKPLEYAVAVILKRPNNPEEFLMVQRPAVDPHLANVWGLPAVMLKPGELPEHAAIRVCVEKLNCDAVAVRFIGAMHQTRGEFDLCLIDIEVELRGSDDPDVTLAQTNGIKYTAQKWTRNVADLLPAAQKGSCCSMLYLTDRGMLKRDNWVLSLD